MGTLTDLHLGWLRARNLRPATIDQRQRAITRLRRALPVDPLVATPADLTDWYAALTDRVTPEARATELSHVRQFYRWLQREGHRADDPTVRLDRPRVPRRLPRPIPTADLVTVLASAPVRVRPWVALAAYAGLRACEIARLRREDVLDGADPPVLIVHEGKGAKQRVVPLHADLAEIVLEYAPARGYLFRRHDGRVGPVSPWLVSHYAADAMRAAGVDATIHQARHWFGTETYRACGDLRVTQELLGHTSPVTTAGYAAWSPTRGAEAVGLLPSLAQR